MHVLLKTRELLAEEIFLYIFSIYIYICILRQHSSNARWDLVSINFIDFFSMSRNNFRTFPLINFAFTFDIHRVAKLS